jgi:competence protein ComEC
MKRVLSVLLAVALLLSVCPNAAATSPVLSVTIETAAANSIFATPEVRVTVKNNSTETLTDVSAATVFSSSVALAQFGDGNTTLSRSSLAGGESFSFSFRYGLKTLQGLDWLLYPVWAVYRLFCGVQTDIRQNSTSGPDVHAATAARFNGFLTEYAVTLGVTVSYQMPTPPEPTPPDPTPPALAALTIRFLDVGQADAALLQCGGQSLLIDGGNAADSNLIYSVLRAEGITHLDYIVATHAHEDHIGGLAGALHASSVGTFYSPVTAYESTAFRNVTTALAAQGKQITVPVPGDCFPIGDALAEVLAPLRDSEEPNNTSIVLRITHGEKTFLFMGDAEYEEEQDLLSSGTDLKADVLKVGHHGSDTSTGYQFLWNVMPTWAVISVGNNNSYGHPTQATLSKLRDADVKLWRTDMQGDITACSDGQTINWQTDRNFDAETNPTVSPDNPADDNAEYLYVGNRNNQKLHLPTCRSLPSENNRIYFLSLEAALTAGYTDACGICKPLG